MRFIETPIFSEAVAALLTDDEYRRLQLALTLRPQQGRLIRGSGGLRKMRWRIPGRGKRGGLRIIYYWEPVQALCLMLYAFRKSSQDELTTGQLKQLRRVVQEEFG